MLLFENVCRLVFSDFFHIVLLFGNFLDLYVKSTARASDLPGLSACHAGSAFGKSGRQIDLSGPNGHKAFTVPAGYPKAISLTLSIPEYYLPITCQFTLNGGKFGDELRSPPGFNGLFEALLRLQPAELAAPASLNISCSCRPQEDAVLRSNMVFLKVNDMGKLWISP